MHGQEFIIIIFLFVCVYLVFSFTFVLCMYGAVATPAKNPRIIITKFDKIRDEPFSNLENFSKKLRILKKIENIY